MQIVNFALFGMQEHEFYINILSLVDESICIFINVKSSFNLLLSVLINAFVKHSTSII